MAGSLLWGSSESFGARLTQVPKQMRKKSRLQAEVSTCAKHQEQKTDPTERKKMYIAFQKRALYQSILKMWHWESLEKLSSQGG